MSFKNWFGRKKSKRKGHQSIERYLLDSIAAFEEGNYQDAAKKFSLIARAVRDHPLAHLMLGRSYIELGEYEMAVQALFDHLKVAPQSVEARIYLGLAYFECGDIRHAEKRFEEAIRLRTDSLLARENLVIARIEAGDLESALDDLVRLHRQYPKDEGILELLVLTLGRQGKWDSAKQYINIKEALATSGV